MRVTLPAAILDCQSDKYDTCVGALVPVYKMVPTAGVEPAQLSPLPPQDSVSTNSTTSAILSYSGFLSAPPGKAAAGVDGADVSAGGVSTAF